MKRLTLGLVASLSFALWGCPIYGDSRADLDRDDPCGGNECASASTSTSTGGSSCNSSADCGMNSTCGEDRQCHPGDCTYWGCSPDYVCAIGSDLIPACVPEGSGSGGGGAGGSSSSSSSSGSGGSGGTPTYCGNPADCASTESCAPDGTCQLGDCTAVGCIHGFTCDPSSKSCKPTNPASCGADSECASLGAGYACVSGVCTAPDDQCFDQAQCPRAGDKCVSGKCTAGCVSDAQCPSGFTCDTGLGVCSDPAQSCTITSDCGSPDKVCVDGACVPRSPDGTCPDGTVWAYNGCIPNESASFICNVDGQQDACAAGSICLHHSCYISCAAPNTTACNSLPSFNVCKSVTTSSGTHAVCGSSSNLGGACDPTVPSSCAGGKLCIDGFCR